MVKFKDFSGPLSVFQGKFYFQGPVYSSTFQACVNTVNAQKPVLGICDSDIQTSLLS